MSQVFSGALQRLQAELSPLSSAWDLKHSENAHPQAGVLVALTAEDVPRVLLGRRAMHLPLHPGEIAFAGGKREAEDTSPWHTAVREAEEEVGLVEGLLRPLGQLYPLITRTGFEVTPCVAAIPPEPVLTVDPGEFDSVFFERLPTFAEPGRMRLEKIKDGAHTRKVPHYQVGNDNIWGVTAAILVLLVNVAYDAGLDLQRDWEQTP